MTLEEMRHYIGQRLMHPMSFYLTGQDKKKHLMCSLVLWLNTSALRVSCASQHASAMHFQLNVHVLFAGEAK